MAFRTCRTLRLLAALIACAGLWGCLDKIPGVYRVPVQQGNVITVEMLQELELGMNKRKVSFILGTPLVVDAFHLDRWDYFYSYASGSADRVQQRASLFFEGDKLIRIEADIDSKIDFHTVTKASENVLIVPKKKKGGFLAMITPGFIARDEEQTKQEEIERSLSTGVNQDQPGSADGAAPESVLDPVLPEPTGAAGVAVTSPPSEIYAPNTSTETRGPATAAPAAAPAPAIERISAKTETQSRYLEQLFEGFGTSGAPQPSSAPQATPAPAEPGVPDHTTRD